MAVFKCKMCGGTIEFAEGATVGICDSCGTKQTLPKVNDDAIGSLFNRANTLRMKSEFDRAEEIYNKIITADETQAEAYWGIILCKFGIEYVEDPKTFKRVPTCHRASFDAISADEDFKLALQYGDAEQRKIYLQEAKAIDAIQKDILNIAKNEKPFDVFICYKETDENGKRTQDSVIANEIYHQLTLEGFKVFYSAITLEDKLGQEYEPYIFAALNSAKVMIVAGTKPEYFTAVWVKNEWSRFLKIMKADRSKLLIPCYKDMDAYELPDDFAHLQAQDMSKIGFINDVVRGIKKVLVKEDAAPIQPSVKETVVMQNENGNIQAFLDRGFMALEDGEWEKADGFFEQALNFDAKLARAYLGKLMAELKVKKEEELKNCAQPFDDKNNCVKSSKFSAEIAEKLKADNDFIRERNETARKQGIYSNAVSAMNTANTEENYQAIALAFESISGFKDSDEKAKECLEKAEVCRKDATYADAYAVLDDSHFWVGKKKDVKAFESSIEKFKSISGWKDADEQIYACQKRIEEIKAKEEADRIEEKRKAEEKRIAVEKAKAKTKKLAMIITPVVAVLIVFIIILNSVILPASNYKKALEAVESGNYSEAYSLFGKYGYYKDTQEQISLAKIKEANALLDEKKYDEAYKILKEIGDTEKINESMYARVEEYLESKEYDNAYALLEQLGDTEKINESMYNRAVEFVDSGDKISAYLLFAKLPGYKDSDNKAKEYKLLYIKDLLNKAKVGDTVVFGAYEQDNNTSNGKEDIEWQVLAKENNRILVISEYALDCQQYNTSFTDVTWQSCSLRKWMNGTFLNNAFSADEQAQIQNTTVSADKNPQYSANPGNATTDKVFLLSIKEVEKYFTSDEDRKCVPTAYAIERYTKGGKVIPWWWLRSPGSRQSSAAYVYDYGSVSYCGSSVGSVSCLGCDISYADFCVRPALWIEIQ